METKIFLGMTVALIGIAIVFLLLIVIAVTIVSILKTLKSLQTQAAKDAIPTSAVSVASIPAFSPSASVPVVSGSIDPSIVAVITAAVAMMMSEPNVGSLLYPGFRVRSIRRVI